MFKQFKAIGGLAILIALAACSGGPSQSGGTLPAAPVTQSQPPAPKTPGLVTVHGMLGRFTRKPMTFGGPLNYNGGVIQSWPKTYLIFWGFHAPGADPDNEADYLTGLVSAVGGSYWLNTVVQYSQSDGSIVHNPTNQLAGVWYDDSPIPAAPSEDDMSHEAVNAQYHFGFDPDANYFIAMPHAVTPYNPSNYCGWHFIDYTLGNYPNGIAYTILPYNTDRADCGKYYAGGKLDGVSVVAGHEIAETQTDPHLNAWYSTGGQEIGDLCAWDVHQAALTGGTYPMQTLWSNNANGCVMATAIGRRRPSNP